LKGDQGNTGSAGSQGTQGVQGLKGDQGNAGAQGTQGNQGTQGVQGTQGNQGAGYYTTSSTSITIGTGSKAFTVSAGLAYTTNQRVRASYNSTNYLEGLVASYTGTT
jgi:hypothetical protein